MRAWSWFSSVVAYGKRACLLSFRLSPGLTSESYSKIIQASHDSTNKRTLLEGSAVAF